MMISKSVLSTSKSFSLKLFAILGFSAFGLISSSCSLKYDETVSAEEKNPEFVFYDTKLTRYENSNKKAEINTGYLEQYKDSDATYAKDVSFKTIDKDGKLETEGNCGLLFFDSKKELYELYDGIKLFNVKQNTRFSADILRWNGKTEQLTSGRTDMVRIEKDDTVIVGSGFSASGVSGRYNFTGMVNGNIVTKSDKEKSDESAGDNHNNPNDKAVQQ